MPNGKPTLGERLAVIETKFHDIVEPMAFKVDHIYDNMPEIVRKVDQHHKIFKHHCKFIDEEVAKQTAEEKRRHEMKSRKTDSKKFKISVVSVIIALLALLTTNFWIIYNM